MKFCNNKIKQLGNVPGDNEKVMTRTAEQACGKNNYLSNYLRGWKHTATVT